MSRHVQDALECLGLGKVELHRIEPDRIFSETPLLEWYSQWVPNALHKTNSHPLLGKIHERVHGNLRKRETEVEEQDNISDETGISDVEGAGNSYMKGSQTVFSHLSDALRTALLYKNGGLYVWKNFYILKL